MQNPDIQRKFVIGDHWLYYKIYAGPKTIDHILTEIVHAIAGSLVNDQIIKKWFFIRYKDPEHHLRIRFQLIDPGNIYIVLERLLPKLKYLLEEDIVSRVQTDTYDREIERYGSNTIELAEDIFHYDSIMVVKFLTLIKEEEENEIRWLFSLKAIDSFLDCFKYSEEEKLNLLDRMKTNFAYEFGNSKRLRDQIKLKLRKYRKTIIDFMETAPQYRSPHMVLDLIIDEKNQNISQAVNGILSINAENKLEIPLDRLMQSYVHMLMNRVFKSKNRTYELICYDFLHRYYLSSRARKKQV